LTAKYSKEYRISTLHFAVSSV